MFQCIPCQWRNLHVQWWAHWLLRCWIGCVWVTVSGTAGALEELEAPLCDPAVVASGGQIECERPRAALPPELPASSGEAPMCDETGASIGVRTPVPELDRGRLEALPCEAVLALFGGKSLDFPRASARLTRPEPAPAPLELALSRGDATPGLSLVLPERAEPDLIPAQLGPRLGASPGYLRAPFRPPLRRS